jgi:hypothetical protein
VSRARRLLSIYAGIGRTCRDWARSLLVLAAIVFVPLGLLEGVTATVEVEALNITNGVKLVALVAAWSAIATTSLLGEVFFSGVVAVSLTHPEHLNPPSLGTIARNLRYGRLIAVDLIYVAIVTIGLLMFVLPGAIAFVWLGLAGPVVEIERRTVREALRRSCSLVRGSFWIVFFVLAPITVVTEAASGWIAALVHHAIGDGLVAHWAAESLTGIAFSPIYAVAAVLLTLELIEAKDGTAPALHSAPAPA